MPLPLRTTIPGAQISPNWGVRRLESDSADAAAAAFGDRLLVRIDPRDIARSPANPTGRKKVHYMAPNRDPAVFTGSGFSAAKIGGLYNGQEVFAFTNTGSEAAGTHNDFKAGPKSLNGVTEFTVFGAAHLDPAIYGVAGLKPVIAMYRDGQALESCIAHQFTGGINYLSIFADQPAGGGENVNLDAGSPPVVAGVPFAYMWRVTGTGLAGAVRLYINQTTVTTVGGAGKDAADAGAIEIMIGHLTADSQQLRGGHGRAYVIQGDTIGTMADQALSAALMAEIKMLYGIA